MSKWFSLDEPQVEERTSWTGNNLLNTGMLGSQPIIEPNVTLNNPHPYGNLPSKMDESSIIEAKLFLFSPKQMYNFKVRPHIYDLKSDNDGLNIMARNFQDNRPLINNMATQACPSLLNMVRPTMNGGHIVNLKNLSECWTFVLTIDSKGMTGFNASMASPVYRHVCTGYCIDEPVNPITQAPNLDAEFKFCHHTTFEYKMNRFGKVSSPNMLANHDVIPSEFIAGGLSVGAAFTQLTPTNMQATSPYQHAMRTFGNDQSHQNMSFAPTMTPGTNPKIDASMKFGKTHLQTLGRYLLAAKEQTAEHSRKDRWNLPNPIAGEDFATAFYRLLASSNNIVASGFGIFEFLSFNQIKHLLPVLHVVPIVIPNARNWDVLPSEANMNANYFSSWIADSLAFICETSGITNFSVTYDSYCGNQWEKEGRWRVHKFETVHGDNRQEAIDCFEQCKLKLEADLFTPIRMASGEFELTLNYRYAAETLIDLHFKDENFKPDALYEHPTQLGGWINPNVGDLDLFQENAEQLQSVVNMLSI